jgi:Ran GTPase-activating protein (RanGAP) involved in mRNA processing and transport
MKSLAKALEKNTTIHTIDLDGNSIGAEGMKSLAEAIKSQLGINFKYIIFAYIFLSMLS